MATRTTWLTIAILTMAVVVPARAQQAEPPAARDMATLREQVSSELWVYGGDQPIHGFLTRLTAQELTLIDEDNHEQIIPLDTIRRIERSGDPIWNGFAIGAAVGVLQSVLLLGGLDDGHVRQKVALAIEVGGVYGLIGAGIDAMHVGRTTVYQAPRAKAGPTIVASRDGRGAMLSWMVRF